MIYEYKISDIQVKAKIKVESYFSIWGCSRKFGEIRLFIVFCVIIYTEIGIMNTINIEKEVQSILKQGFLDKQSRFWKTWRSRWFVLTPQYLMTFKQRKVYNSPTQVMSLKSITSIKSSDEQTSKQFTFIREQIQIKIHFIQQHHLIQKENNGSDKLVRVWLNLIMLLSDFYILVSVFLYKCVCGEGGGREEYMGSIWGSIWGVYGGVYGEYMGVYGEYMGVYGFDNFQFVLIMIKLRKIVQFSFARSRARRQIQFRPQLKDFTTQQTIKQQTDQFRAQFQKIPTQTFNTILTNPNPKLQQKFHIQKKQLSKKIREVYKQKVNIDQIQTHDDDDLNYLASSKSHLHDQKEEIQFQEKFKQQLFRTKEVKRLIGKKEKNIDNYVDGRQKDVGYLGYEEAKKELKNRKISNMMKMNRNNEQLELLISSGLFNNPQNIQTLIQQLNRTATKPEMLQHKTTERIESTGARTATKQLIIDTQSIEKSVADRMQDIGPEQLKQRNKVNQFIQMFQQQHNKDKQSCIQDLRLLNQIRQYQQQIFLNRYQAIHFRFKGRVDFGFFKESQLISYIKNENIQPSELLQIFSQNSQKLSKFKTPIITPSVTSALYSKTSLYRFPETDKNNRINMLNDHNFQELQSKTFKLITKLSDTDFCSVVWAYANNHKDEQGVLRRGQYTKICEVIANQVAERVFNLNDGDLGLVCRGLSKIELGGVQSWDEVVGFLGNRLATVEDDYAIQSIFQFLLCLSGSKQIVNIISQNIKQFKSYRWQQKNTLLTFVGASGLLIKQSRQSIQQLNKIRQILLINNKQIIKILQEYSINNLPQFLTILRQSNASLSLQMQKTVNLCKKLTVDNIKTQKQLIKQYTICNVVGSFVLIDFQRYQHDRKSKLMLGRSQQENVISGANWIKKLTLKSILPFQPIPYNSSSYFVYHELATLAHTQMYNINNLYLAKLLQNLSLSKYKNQRLFDDIASKILQTILQTDQFSVDAHRSKKSIARQLAMIVNSYSFQKRNSYVMNQALSMVLGSEYYSELCQESPHFLLRFVTGVLSVTDPEQIGSENYKKLQRIFYSIIQTYLHVNVFIEEEKAAIAYCDCLFGKFMSAQKLAIQMDSYKDPAVRFIIAFSNYINKKSTSQSVLINEQKQFFEAEQKYYKHIHHQILQNQNSIGTKSNSNEIYKWVLEKQKENKNEASKIINRKWTIEYENNLNFIATYDHLMSKQQEDGLFQHRLYGVWKMYEVFARKSGLNVKIWVVFQL